MDPRHSVFTTTLAFALIGATFDRSCDASAASFQGLGIGGAVSQAYAISGDGSTVVGNDEARAFRWTRAGGLVLLDLGDLSVEQDPYSFAYATSYDGSIVVGQSGAFQSRQEQPTRWTASGSFQLERLPMEPGDTAGVARAISGNGSVIAGVVHSSAIGTRSYRWRSSGESDSIVPGGHGAFAMSGDGSVIVGGAQLIPHTQDTAYHWTEQTGPHFIPAPPSDTGSTSSIATEVSYDGTVTLVSRASRPETFIWTAGEGLRSFPELAGGIEGIPMALNRDGSVIVGELGDGIPPPLDIWIGESSPAGNLDEGAFIWDAAHGVRNLFDVLEGEYGLDLTGWRFHQASEISADGMTIVGSGTNPDGRSEWWIATLPEPSHVLLALALGFTLLARIRRATPRFVTHLAPSDNC